MEDRLLTRFRAALFDLDGTIFDSRIDLGAVRRSLDLPRDGRSFIDQLSELPSCDQERGMALLVEAEMRGIENGTLLPGAEALIAFLAERGLRCILVTNNSRASAEVFLRRHPLPFDLVLTRDDGAPKPDPGSFRKALAHFGIAPHEAIAIGDAHLDLLAAHAAGVAEIILVAPPPWVLEFVPGDIAHRRARDLVEVLEIVRSLL